MVHVFHTYLPRTRVEILQGKGACVCSRLQSGQWEDAAQLDAGVPAAFASVLPGSLEYCFLFFCGSSNLIRQIEWCATILVDANDAPLMMQRSTRECVRPSTPGPGAYSNQSGKRPASQLDPRSLWGLWYSSRQKLPPEALQQQSHL